MGTILFIITVIVGGLILCGICSFIVTVIFWEASVYETAPRISYDAFVKWYKVTPKERWKFEDTYVRFYTKNANVGILGRIMMNIPVLFVLNLSLILMS